MPPYRKLFCQQGNVFLTAYGLDVGATTAATVVEASKGIARVVGCRHGITDNAAKSLIEFKLLNACRLCRDFVCGKHILDGLNLCRDVCVDCRRVVRHIEFHAVNGALSCTATSIDLSLIHI